MSDTSKGDIIRNAVPKEEDILKAIQINVGLAGARIKDAMQAHLVAGNHVDTGNLIRSIRSETTVDGNTIRLKIYIDAEGKNGAWYAEFLELGSGEAHGRPNGRTGYWCFQNSHGQWCMTDGMDADPFIKPAVEEVLNEWLPGLLDNIVYNVIKYHGSKPIEEEE